MLHNGVPVRTHDKGLSTACVHLSGGKGVVVQTFHGFPLRKFEIALGSPEARGVLEPMQKMVMDNLKFPPLLQGDFNLNTKSVSRDLSILFDSGVQEIVQTVATNTRGRTYDHVLFAGMRPLSHRVVTDVLTDHFPLITEFEL